MSGQKKGKMLNASENSHSTMMSCGIIFIQQWIKLKRLSASSVDRDGDVNVSFIASCRANTLENYLSVSPKVQKHPF